MSRSVVQRIARYSGIRASAWVLFAIAGYVASIYIASYIAFVVNQFGGSWNTFSTSGSLVLRCVVYAVYVAVLIGGLRVAGIGRAQVVRVIGLVRNLDWRDIGLGVVGFLAYGLLAAVVLTLASYIPGYNAAQTQDVGVTTLYGQDRLIAFVVLVIIAPFFEEVLFRGLLYGYMRRLGILSWAAALAVSILFGLAHGQWNVGLDVFCLSLILCILRELTGSLWAGIIVHIIKNFVAFCLVYLVARG